MIAQQIINGVMLGAIYVLVAVSFTLAIGVLNFLNFSIPGLFMLGGMVTWLLMKQGSAPALAIGGALFALLPVLNAATGGAGLATSIAHGLWAVAGFGAGVVSVFDSGTGACETVGDVPWREAGVDPTGRASAGRLFGSGVDQGSSTGWAFFHT